MFGGDQRPHAGGLVQRVTHRHMAAALHKFCNEFIGKFLFHQNPAAGVATFTGIEEGAKDHRIQRRIDITIGKKNLRIFTTQFHRHFFECVG